MTASLHSTLILLSQQVVRNLPGPVIRALDAWSLRVARRRALARQQMWQRQKAAAQAASTAVAACRLEPGRD